MTHGETGLEKGDYLFLQRFLDATKSNLFFAKGVIMVEGDAENLLLPVLADILGYPLEKYSVGTVKGFIAPRWTLEYCLAMSCLSERFYATHRFYSFEDFAKQLKAYNRRDYNSFPMRPLGWKTPNQVLRDYLRSV